MVITDGDDCSLAARDALARAGLPLDDEAAVDRACAASDGLADPAASLKAAVSGSSTRLGVISGGAGPTAACEGAGPAPRLASVLFPERTMRVDVCDENWTDVLVTFSRIPPIPSALCVPSGLACDGVLGHTSVAGNFIDDTALPWCGNDVATPCLRPELETPSCPFSTLIDLDLGRERVPTGSVVEVRCQLPCDYAGAAF